MRNIMSVGPKENSPAGVFQQYRRILAINVVAAFLGLP